MPLKLHVGLSKKIGLPNYGSLGASCSVEVELDSHLLARGSGEFHEEVRRTFEACAQAVQEELTRHAPSNGQTVGSEPADSADGNTQSNGHSTNGDSHAFRSRAAGRPATEAQVRAIFAIANRQQVDVPQLLQERFGVERPEGLSLNDASRFIDELQVMSQGAGGARCAG